MSVPPHTRSAQGAYAPQRWLGRVGIGCALWPTYRSFFYCDPSCGLPHLQWNTPYTDRIQWDWERDAPRVRVRGGRVGSGRREVGAGRREEGASDRVREAVRRK